MAKNPRINFDDLLNDGGLEAFLPASPQPELPREVLSPPELITFHWLSQLCSCGREYTAQEHGPTIRHTISRRQGFGLHVLGKVYIPAVPGMDLSDIPTQTITRSERIYHCPSCIGTKSSLELFPDSREPDWSVKMNGQVMPPHVARWHDMHNAARPLEVQQTENDMRKRKVDFDDLLVFKTTELDLRSAVANTVLCDPEKQIEL
jgi:hypothetical protein